MIDDTGRSTSDVCVREHLYYYKIFINKLVYVTTVNGPVFACFGFTTGMRWYFCCFASWRPASQHLTTSACSIAPIPSQAAANVEDVLTTKVEKCAVFTLAISLELSPRVFAPRGPLLLDS